MGTTPGDVLPRAQVKLLTDAAEPSTSRELAESDPELALDQDLSIDPGIVIAVGDVATGRLVHEALSALSAQVILVSSAMEALREIVSVHPALLVVDDELPLVRGLDLAGRVRSDRSDVEIILLTPDETIISLVERLRIERLRCISKPFDLEMLRQVVGLSKRALAQRRGRSEYNALLAELQEQKSRFERRIENLERQRPRTRSLQEPSAPDPTRLRPPMAPHVLPEGDGVRPRRAPPSLPPAPHVPAGSLRGLPPAPHPMPDAPEAPPEDFSVVPEAPQALPEDLHVLVVDDDPLVLRAMARTLSKQHVTLAENGVAATRALERSRPDVIVSDLRMPEMDGLALAEEVRRRWPELSERIVFVSGAGSQIERAELEAPTQPVLRKPVEGALLESRIAEVLANALPSRKA